MPIFKAHLGLLGNNKHSQCHIPGLIWSLLQAWKYVHHHETLVGHAKEPDCIVQILQEGGQPDSQAQAEELSGLWEAWQDRFAFFQRLLKGCAARADPALGLSELAASIMPASE